MKKLFCFVSALLILTACQKKQYYTSSPEIDLVKKGNEAYFRGDWQTLKSVYADTAKIYDNPLDFNNAITPDQSIEGMKANLSNYAEYKMGDNPVYEMIVNDQGDKWVHNWFFWSGKTKNGKDASAPVNLSFLVKDGKVVLQINIYNSLPGYLATQPSDSSKVIP